MKRQCLQVVHGSAHLDRKMASKMVKPSLSLFDSLCAVQTASRYEIAHSGDGFQFVYHQDA